jgi:hypothetical protein
MGWLDTNDSPIVHWSDRPQLTDARWSINGVPLEIAIQLANEVGADAWINIPHMADDDFVTQAATLVSSNLAPGLKAYVEYSNEVWNFTYEQATYAGQQGMAMGFGPTPFQALLEFYSLRAVQVFDGFTSVFGSEAPARLRRVMGAQAANSFVASTELGFQNASASTDALAIAPYIGDYLGTPQYQAAVDAMTLDDLFTELTTNSVPTALSYAQDNASVAQMYGVSLVAYEGGQSLVGVNGVENDDTISALFDAANRDPRMGSLYSTYLAGWKAAGGSYFVHFANCGLYNKYGRWGSLEWIDEDAGQAPKYTALQAFIAGNPMP